MGFRGSSVLERGGKAPAGTVCTPRGFCGWRGPAQAWPGSGQRLPFSPAIMRPELLSLQRSGRVGWRGPGLGPHPCRQLPQPSPGPWQKGSLCGDPAAPVPRRPRRRAWGVTEVIADTARWCPQGARPASAAALSPPASGKRSRTALASPSVTCPCASVPTPLSLQSFLDMAYRVSGKLPQPGACHRPQTCQA